MKASFVTHKDSALTHEAVIRLTELAGELGIELSASEDELSRHDLSTSDVQVADGSERMGVCICLGGDGTILRGLRSYAPAGTPVFGINFGEVGFLAASEPESEGIEQGLRRALTGGWETIDLPGLRVTSEGGEQLAFNDVALQRRPGLRVAEIAYSVASDEVGRVRCDGVVICTPAGSTGYNLANGGPVMAWGVSGFTVSFIAPHSLTARALVVAPNDQVRVGNQSESEPVDLFLDGRPSGELQPGKLLAVDFVERAGLLAQTEGATFYHRLREKFGRLAN